MSHDVLQRTTRDGVTTVTIDRPPVNALSADLCAALCQAFRDLSSSADTACIVLAGAGTRAFCAGLDFRDFVDASSEGDDSKTLLVREMYDAVHRCERPVIAAIDGPAIGAGAVLATVCDMRVASPAASFTLPEINLGRIGGAAHHGRLMPQGTLRRLVLTGEAMPAADALRVGLVDELADNALDAASALAAAIARRGRLAVTWAKRALNEVEGMRFDEGYRVEQALNAEFRKTHDAREAARAWIEKRRPVFRGE